MTTPTFNPSDFFEIRQSGQVAVIRLRGDIYSLVTDVVKSDYFISRINEINQTDEIKGLLVLNEKGIFNEDGYDQFMHRILEPAHSEDSWPRFKEPKIRFGEIHAINRFIRTMVDFKKVFIVGLSGEVVTPFFGISMAADVKYGSEDLTFVLAHRKYGLHPSGALPFFLSKFLHHSKALEILLRHKPISSAEAFDIGLVNELLPGPDFEKNCLKKATELCDIRSSTLHYTKRLLNFTRDDLKAYLEYEAQMINL